MERSSLVTIEDAKVGLVMVQDVYHSSQQYLFGIFYKSAFRMYIILLNNIYFAFSTNQQRYNMANCYCLIPYCNSEEPWVLRFKVFPGGQCKRLVS